MRHPLLVARLVGAVIGVVVLPLSRDSAPHDPHPGGGHTTPMLGMEALIEQVAGLTGPTRVKAIVGRILPDQHLFSLVDLSGREELLGTGQSQCVTLPVRWSGQMSAPRAVIPAPRRASGVPVHESLSCRHVMVHESVEVGPGHYENARTATIQQSWQPQEMRQARSPVMAFGERFTSKDLEETRCATNRQHPTPYPGYRRPRPIIGGESGCG